MCGIYLQVETAFKEKIFAEIQDIYIFFTQEKSSNGNNTYKLTIKIHNAIKFSIKII